MVNEAQSEFSSAELPPQRAGGASSRTASGDIDAAEASMSRGTRLEQLPFHWREGTVVLLLVILCDMTVYRGEGYAGYALLFLLAPTLLLLGSPTKHYSVTAVSIVGGMLWILAAGMLWCGSEIQVVVSVCLGCAFGLALSGSRPFVLDSAAFPFRALFGGLSGWLHYGHSIHWSGRSVNTLRFLSIVLPFLAFMTFSLLFLLANPDLFETFGERLDRILTALRRWIVDWAPPPLEMLFWLAVAWLAVGALRPHMFEPVAAEVIDDNDKGRPVPGEHSWSPMYPACRNTLATVIVLFTIYLIFEFKTLWFRVFPVGFYYSGYAHQGAAWLTVALALATVILSLVFRGGMLRDPRLNKLKRLAWTWSLLNVLLAIAVYHRLYIYIGFNGLTRMRIVGFFGMSAVLIGFLLVLWKIAAQRDFVWLMHRQLWTLFIAIYLFAVTPVDVLVVNYNVDRILAGDLAPSVQISAHEIDSAGFRHLRPLLDCRDAVIRQGVRAMHARRLETLKATMKRRESLGWTTFQIADRLLLAELQRHSKEWAEYLNPARRRRTLQQFHTYVYQWY